MGRLCHRCTGRHLLAHVALITLIAAIGSNARRTGTVRNEIHNPLQGIQVHAITTAIDVRIQLTCNSTTQRSERYLHV
jgi:hypothetical protein